MVNTYKCTHAHLSHTRTHHQRNNKGIIKKGEINCKQPAKRHCTAQSIACLRGSQNVYLTSTKVIHLQRKIIK